jgi:hypothetical protein
MRWLNTNQGFVMSVLTLVYVAAGIMLYRAALKANELSAKSLQQALELERRRVRPYVVFDLQPRLGIVWLVLRNIGATAAHSVRVAVVPQLETEINGERVQSALTRDSISFLPPGRVLEDILDEGGVVLQRYPHPVFSGELTYADGDGRTYTEPFTIDLTLELDMTAEILDTRSRTDEEKIARAIRELALRLK